MSLSYYFIVSVAGVLFDNRCLPNSFLKLFSLLSVFFPQYRPVLHKHCQANQLETVKCLLEQCKQDINGQDYSSSDHKELRGERPLHAAVRGNALKVAAYLIEQKANLEGTNEV